MADEKFVRIGVSIDKAGAQQAAQTVGSVRKEFDTLKTATAQAGGAAQQAARVTDLGWKPVRATIQNVRDDIEDARASFSRIGEGSASFFRGISGLTGGALGEIAQISRQIEEVTRGFQKMTAQGIGPLLKELGPTVLAAGALSIGIAGVTALVNAFNQEVEKQKAQLKEEMAIRQELRELTRTATSEEAKLKRATAQQAVDDIKAEIAALEKRRIELLAGGFTAETMARQQANKALLDEQNAALIVAEEKLVAYNKALEQNAFLANDLKEQTNKMFSALGQGIQSISDFAEAAARKATEAYYRETQKAEEEALKKVQQRNTDLAGAQERYENDVQTIEETSLQKRADIQQKYNDQLVSIAAKAAQDAQDRLTKLEQTRQDLAANFVQGEADAAQKIQQARLDVEIKAQTEERNALRDHLRTLEDIRRNAQQREQGFLLDRNFLGLLQSRQQTGFDIETENRKYLNAQQDRKQALQDQVQETARAFEQERQARLQAYQKQLADAQTAYNREMAAAQQARQRELALAVEARVRGLQEEAQSSQATLMARRKLHIQELQDIYDFGARKLKAERDFLQRAIDMIAQVNVGARGVRTPRGATIEPYAEGGAMSPFQWGLVNEGRNREAFNGVPFPGGAGLFYPLQPGYVSNVSNSNRMNVSLTFNMPPSSSQPETVRLIKQEVVSALEKVIKN